jgi:acyl-[acyl carrier protein]--UDP-N-acetylglucosamine O-acyltransferase
MKSLIKSMLEALGLRERKSIAYKIGNVKYHNTLVDSLIPEFVEIGDNFISAPGSVVLAHDASLLSQFGLYRIERTKIGSSVFLGANAVVLPGVTIGDGAIVGAGSVVTKDVAPHMVVAGNPARVISTVEAYREKCEAKGVLIEAPESFNKVFENQLLTKSDIEALRVKCREVNPDK